MAIDFVVKDPDGAVVAHVTVNELPGWGRFAEPDDIGERFSLLSALDPWGTFAIPSGEISRLAGEARGFAEHVDASEFSRFRLLAVLLEGAATDETLAVVAYGD